MRRKEGTIIEIKWDGEKYVYVIQLDDGTIIEVEEDKVERA